MSTEEKIQDFMTDTELMEVSLGVDTPDLEVKRVIIQLFIDGVPSEVIWGYLNSFNTDEDE